MANHNYSVCFGAGGGRRMVDDSPHKKKKQNRWFFSQVFVKSTDRLGAERGLYFFYHRKDRWVNGPLHMYSNNTGGCYIRRLLAAVTLSPSRTHALTAPAFPTRKNSSRRFLQDRKTGDSCNENRGCSSIIIKRRRLELLFCCFFLQTRKKSFVSLLLMSN